VLAPEGDVVKVSGQSHRSRASWSLAVAGLLSLAAIALAPLASAATSSTPALVRSFDGAPVDFMTFEEDLYFSTNVPDAKLWRSDGTSDGTAILADIRPDGIEFTGRSLVSGSHLYLTADDGTTGVELWRTDGTDTEQAADLCPGACSSFPTGLTELGGQLYFNAFSTADGLLGRQLHRYDPTSETFTKVLGIPDPRDLTVVGDHLYLIADQTLQRTDGVGVEVVPVPEGWSRPSDLVRLGSSLFFSLRDGNRNEQVFATDGSTTRQITAIEPLADEQTSVRSLDAVGDRLYVTVDQGDGTKLWVVDSALDEPRSLEVVEDGVSQGPLAAWRFAALEGVVYFNGFNSQTGSQLWRTDGTVAGTRIVEDLGRVQVGTAFGQPTYNEPDPNWLTAFGDRLYFSAYVAADADTYAEGTHLFRTTGDGNGVEFVAEFGQFQQPSSLTVAGDALLFSADSGLWRISSTGDDPGGPGDPGDPDDPGDPVLDPVTVVITEAITVSDAVRAAGPAQVVVTEQVTVVDEGRAAGPATIVLTEQVAVADGAQAAGPATVTVPESVAVSDAVMLEPSAADESDPGPDPPAASEVVAECTLFVLGAEVTCDVGGLEANQLVQALVVVNPTLFDGLVLTDPDGVASFTFGIPADLPPASTISITIRALDGSLLFARLSPTLPARDAATDPREGADTERPSEVDRRPERVDGVARSPSSRAPGADASARGRELSRTGAPLFVLLALSASLMGTGLRLRGHVERGCPAIGSGRDETVDRRRP
jgi:ELWxxDGT repeat protein